VPLRLYYKGGRIELAVSLAKGASHDKREAIRKRESIRDTGCDEKSSALEK
jgi:tmRNA-binding protein